MKRNHTNLIVAVFFFSTCLFAALRPGEISRTYRGLRPLGMGGAFIAIADDYNALFYNPAGLNNVEKWRLDFFSLGLGISSQIKNLYNNIDRMSGDVADIAAVVEESIGANHHFYFEFVPSFVMHNFGVALVEDLKFNVRVRNQAVPEVHVYAKNDVVVVGGLAGRFWERVQLGIALKTIYRFYSNSSLNAMDVLNEVPELDDILKEGQGVGIDIGGNYILPFPFKQKVGIQIADVLNTKFNLGLVNAVGEAGDPPSINRTINLGYKIEPPALFYLKPVVAVDFRDVFNETRSSYVKRLHIGAEMKLPFIFTARFGFGQGFFALGGSADFWLAKIEFATYAEELGVGYQNPDRRYYLRFTMGF